MSLQGTMKYLYILKTSGYFSMYPVITCVCVCVSLLLFRGDFGNPNQICTSNFIFFNLEGRGKWHDNPNQLLTFNCNSNNKGG